MHYHGNHSLPVCPNIRHPEIRRVWARPVTPRPLQPLSEPGPVWFAMNQICQWLKTDTWAAPSRENVARSIQLQSLINNSGREMPQYRAQQDLKIDHAPLRRNGGKERGGRNGSTRGASSSTPRPQAQVFTFSFSWEFNPIIVSTAAAFRAGSCPGSEPCKEAESQKTSPSRRKDVGGYYPKSSCQQPRHFHSSPITAAAGQLSQELYPKL